MRAVSAHLKHELMTDADSSMRQATAKARELDRDAFACRIAGAPRNERCQIRLHLETLGADGLVHVITALVGSGPTWAEALEMYWNYHQANAVKR